MPNKRISTSQLALARVLKYLEQNTNAIEVDVNNSEMNQINEILSDYLNIVLTNNR